MKYIHRIILILTGLILFHISYFPSYCKNVVVVIDPGHGGDAMGGNIDDRIERDINLITASAMKDRLEQYEGVDVYLTRENNTDKELTRKERFDFAKDVNADFLFSIHYNMSEYHTLFGSEVWVASKGSNYVKGYQFATIEMKALTELGLFDRGIKNKLNKDRDGEYYGILKYAEEYNIPAVIIEHCHLDEERDSEFWNEESYKRFGEIDADCVAKFYSLSSPSLGIDNSSFQNIAVEAPSKRLDRDYSEPEYCTLQIKDNGDTVTAHIEAYDPDNYIQYYQVSLDGGDHFGRLEEWTDRSSTSMEFDIPKQIEQDYNVVVRAMNQYDLYLASDSVYVEGLPKPVEEEDIESIKATKKYQTVEINKSDQEKKTALSPIFIFVVTLVVLFVTFNIFFALYITNSRRKKRRRKKNHETR